jgi:hypothetical protein
MEWKGPADNAVVRGIFQRATGYDATETKAQWVESDLQDPVTGEWHRPGRWETIELIKHYPPDPTAGAIWINNRRMENWKAPKGIGGLSMEAVTAILEALPEDIQVAVRQEISVRLVKGQ